jgi:hypothetical protein
MNKDKDIRKRGRMMRREYGHGFQVKFYVEFSYIRTT